MFCCHFLAKCLLAGMLWTSLACRAATIQVANITTYEATGGRFGTRVQENETLEGILYVTGSHPLFILNETLGCDTLLSPNPYNGSIIMVERGICSFVQKVYVGQLAGAKAVVVFNRDPNETLITMQPDLASRVTSAIKIPSFFVTRETGLDLIAKFVEVYTLSSIGLNISITVEAGEYESDGGFFTPLDYSALTFVVGLYFGFLVVYYIGYFVWGLKQLSRKSDAVRKLKRTKYARQTIPQIISEMPPPPEDGNDVENDLVDQTEAQISIVEDVDLRREPVASGGLNVRSDPVTNTDLQVQSLSVRPSSTQGEITEVNKPISTAPFSRFRRKKKTGAGNDNQPLYDSGVCTVCLEDFQEGEDVMILQCRHLFHTNCVQTWLEQHGQCPFCKTSVLPTGAVTLSNEYARVGWGRCFAYPVLQTVLVWFFFFCVTIVVGYFLVAAGMTV